MRASLKIAWFLGAAALLAAAAVLWKMQHRDSPRRLSEQAGITEKRPPHVRTPTKVLGQPAVSGHPVAGLSWTRKNSGPGNMGTSTRMSGRPGSAPLPTGTERVRLVVNPDSNLGFAERVKAVRAIRTELTGPEVDAFSRYLRTPTPQSGQDPDGEHWLRNVMLDTLVQQAEVPRGLADLLVAVYQNPAQDEVMRDYAVQHMVPAYELVSAPEQANLQKALWQAVGETDTSIAGTALLALLDVVGGSGSVLTDSGLRRAEVATATQAGADATLRGSAQAPRVPPVDEVRLAQTALNLATDGRCGELARITAVQVCGRLGVDQALPIVEQLAQTAPSMPLRIAATAALGDIGGTEAVQLLQWLAESPEPRQALAAQSALLRAEAASVKQAKR